MTRKASIGDRRQLPMTDADSPGLWKVARNRFVACIIISSFFVWILKAAFIKGGDRSPRCETWTVTLAIEICAKAEKAIVITHKRKRTKEISRT